MKKLLLLFIIMITGIINAQNNAQICAQANPFCVNGGSFTYLNTVNTASAQPEIDYQCLFTQPNPTWFYIPVGQPGTIHLQLSQVAFSGPQIDVDYICYGPFTDLQAACNNAGTDNIVGCSYSAAPVENLVIPQANAGEYYLLLITNFSNQAGEITIAPQAANTAIFQCTGTNLLAFLDSNNNGIKDSSESNFTLGNFIFQKNNDGINHSVTTNNGNYILYDLEESNTYDLMFTVHPEFASYYNISTSYSGIPFAEMYTTGTYYFPVTLTQPYNDVSVNVIPTQIPMPGFTYTNTIVYKNNGTDAVSGSLNFTKDSAVTIINISNPNVITTPTGFNYNYDNLQPLESRTITVTMQVPVIPEVELGQLTTATAGITSSADDINTGNSTSSTEQVIVGSYDPNDITESRGEEIVITQFNDSDYLYYTVRFQNTGTASAQDVVVNNILNEQLDSNTFEMLYASHAFVTDKVNNGINWTFNNIMLPDATTNEAASHGYIYYRVKPLPGYAVGNIIPNTAGIYFDFNPAIITNTFNTEFINESLQITANTTARFTIYPNPAHDVINIAAANAGDTIISVNIYDITGKAVLSQNSGTAINVSELHAGMYFIQVTGNDNTVITKKLVIK